MPLIYREKIILVRGGGDLATGVVQKFCRAGFIVVVLETQEPTAIRRTVSLSEAVYDGFANVEDMVCRKVSEITELDECWRKGEIPLLVDPLGESIKKIKPSAVVDAIMAKKNMDTFINMADVTIALGPGFNAGKDVHAVIETLRGHDLGRLILQGCAKPDTGVPGDISGENVHRVIRAPIGGKLLHKKQIGSIVEQGDVLFTLENINMNGEKPENKMIYKSFVGDADIGETDTGGIYTGEVGTAITSVDVKAPMSGLLRGLLREGAKVHSGMKVADIDPRTDIDCSTISDKARCVGGAALEAYLYFCRGELRSPACNC